jgi:hypothetical protein
MIKLVRHLVLSVLIFVAIVLAACSGQQQQPQTGNANRADGKQPSAPVPAIEKKTAATGTVTANPNPIKVCDGSNAGVTTLSWSATGTPEVELRIGTPDGGQFARTGPIGRKETGKWVGDGMVIYLQDVFGGKPLTAEYTIATVTLNITREGCP